MSSGSGKLGSLRLIQVHRLLQSRTSGAVIMLRSLEGECGLQCGLQPLPVNRPRAELRFGEMQLS